MALRGSGLLALVERERGEAMSKGWYDRGGHLWGRVTIKGTEYREPLGRTVAGTSESLRRRLAREWAEQKRRDLARADGPTFDDIAVFFVEQRLPELMPRGAERYRLSLRMLLPYFTSMPLGEIDSKALRAFETARRAEGRASGTIRRDLQCLSAAIEFYAVEHEIEIANPAQIYLRRRAKQRALVEAPPRRRYLSHDEEARLLATCAARAAKDRRISGLADAIAFAIETGLRLNEQFSMRWADVDMRLKRVRVIGKGGKERVVPMSERAAQILAQQTRRIRVADDEDWVWTRPNGARYPHRTKAFESAVEAAGLKDVRWHDLRRTCGCRKLQDQGWSKEQVQLLLGHESVQTTERIYAFLEIENLEGHGTKGGTGATESK